SPALMLNGSGPFQAWVVPRFVHVRSAVGSVADPDLTPPPAGGGVNMAILEACAVVGVIAEVGVTVIVIAREVTVRAAAEEAAEAMMSLVEAAAEARAVKLGTTKAAHVAACESTT